MLSAKPCLLYTSPFFDETPWDKLPLAQKDQLMQKNATTIRVYPKNTRIVLDAASGDSIYLYRGQAKIFIFNEAGIERLLFYLAPKNSCTCGYPNISMTLETTEECEIYFLNTKKMIVIDQGIEQLLGCLLYTSRCV